jgi:mono/diheme cytochrome c family protein
MRWPDCNKRAFLGCAAASIGSALLLVAALAGAAATTGASRGELLYTTYCIGCHTTQVHWRDGKQATSWPQLKAEVRRWQKTAGLSLEDDDIDALAAYLNGLYYHFPEGESRRSGDARSPRTVAVLGND